MREKLDEKRRYKCTNVTATHSYWKTNIDVVNRRRHKGEQMEKNERLVRRTPHEPYTVDLNRTIGEKSVATVIEWLSRRTWKRVERLFPLFLRFDDDDGYCDSNADFARGPGRVGEEEEEEEEEEEGAQGSDDIVGGDRAGRQAHRADGRAERKTVGRTDGLAAA